MDRRGVLAALGAAISGCTRPGLVPAGDPTPRRPTADGPPTVRVADGPTAPDDDGVLALEEYWYLLANAETELEIAHAPVVHGVALREGELRVRIEPTRGIRGHRIEQIGLSAVLYAVYQDDHGGPPLLRGFLVDASGEPQATYRCKQAWAEDYLAEVMDGNRLSAKVQSTVRPV